MKPLPKTKAVGGDDALSFFGLNAPETPTGASGDGSGDERILALEADVRAVRAESAALEAAKAEAERKAGDLERQLAAERQMWEAAEAERERLRGEVMRLRNELEDALTAPSTPSATAAPVQEVRVDGLLRSPTTVETFPGEVREHVLAALSEAHETAESSERERRAAVLGDVLAANKPSGELESRRKAMRQSLSVGKYFMFNAAVASEAVDGTLQNANAAVKSKYVPFDWSDYDPQSWAANWHKWFNNDATDSRGKMGWPNYFSTALARAGTVYNYYSTGDPIFLESDTVPGVTTGISQYGESRLVA